MIEDETVVMPMTHDKPDRTPLIDSFGRRITYLRLSVTDRCNLRCQYCMAEDMTFLPRSNVLSFEEILAVAGAFTARGVHKIRLTGGEPLVRNQIVDLTRRLAQLPGLRELVMTTNGLLLPKYAQPLRDAGLGRLNISLDSLDPASYQRITRRGNLEEALAGIKAAQAAGFPRIKLNVVVMKGINDHELTGLTRFALEQHLDIAFIEEMPLGHIDSHRRGDTQLSNQTVRQSLQDQFGLVPSTVRTGGPAQYWQKPGHNSRIGFISPHSHNFCGDCNRVRLTAEGQLLTCLGNDHSKDLKAVIRANPGDEQALHQALDAAIAHKPERHHFDPEETRIVRFMNATGG